MKISHTAEHQDYKHEAEAVNQAEYSMVSEQFGVQSFMRRTAVNTQVWFLFCVWLFLHVIYRICSCNLNVQVKSKFNQS